MTEQEKREKAIAEMTRHFGEMARCHCECDDSKISCYKCFAIKVYDAGYRKEEAVQKETATRIYEYLRIKEFYDSFPVVDFDEVRNICEEFGVEV